MDGEAHPEKVALRQRRDRVVAQLTESFARDELGLDAFETRIEEAYRCRSSAELDALVADLPVRDPPDAIAVVVAEPKLAPAMPAGALARAEPRPTLRALFSNIERADGLEMSGTVGVEAIFGNLELDLRAAHFDPGVTELRVRSVFASIEIVVPADVAVEIHGAAVFGNFEGASRPIADPDAPKLRIFGSAVFASVVVKTAPPLRVQRLAAEIRARRLLGP